MFSPIFFILTFTCYIHASTSQFKPKTHQPSLQNLYENMRKDIFSSFVVCCETTVQADFQHSLLNSLKIFWVGDAYTS